MHRQTSADAVTVSWQEHAPGPHAEVGARVSSHRALQMVAPEQPAVDEAGRAVHQQRASDQTGCEFDLRGQHGTVRGGEQGSGGRDRDRQRTACHVVVATLHTSSAAQTVQRYLKLIPSDRMENAMLSFADSFRGILCQRLLFDESRGKRFPIHELLLPYDSVCGMIRRGEFKNLEQELEAGFTRGMLSFERCLNNRMGDGWKPTQPKKSGYAEHEVYDYLQRENLTSIYAIS
jgi:hypothetical protein